MSCRYYTEATIGWMLNNKRIVFLAVLNFCLFVSMLAMIGQRNRAYREIENLKEQLNSNDNNGEENNEETPEGDKPEDDKPEGQQSNKATPENNPPDKSNKVEDIKFEESAHNENNQLNEQPVKSEEEHKIVRRSLSDNSIKTLDSRLLKLMGYIS
ncbi:uncharacterized protein LOC113510671 [Galleria mellonella]|uniref:Uncharacterized protein LOC113510671 n=1 Tax=Galleria mellonella TaxID=7137 RepID=A0A6J1WA43_GALME|nr:uncharacterized protein LOC113510671 [Galleria mellonella]